MRLRSVKSRPASPLKFVEQKYHQRGDPPNPQKQGTPAGHSAWTRSGAELG